MILHGRYHVEENADARWRNPRWGKLSAAVGVQHRAQRTDRIAVRSVVDVHAPAVGLDQTGAPELGHPVALDIPGV